MQSSEERVGCVETAGRADFVKALGHFEPGEQPAPSQVAEEIGQIKRVVGRPNFQGIVCDNPTGVSTNPVVTGWDSTLLVTGIQAGATTVTVTCTIPIQTSAYERVGQTHTKRNVEYIAGGAAVGAIVGQVLGRDSGSTLKGAAAGAAVGTGVAAATGDLDFTIDAGRTVAFTLEQPVRVR